MTRTYCILAADPTTGREETREYDATSLAEALTMAEADDAGVADYLYGICPDDYAQATAEGIDFNVADGLLL
jgi:hypothetical protein